MARIRYGAGLIVAAFALLGVVVGVAVSQFSTASDVTAVVGSVTTVVGTVIGAFFGVQAGAAGKEAAESLAYWLIRLLSDREEARAMGQRARDILLRNRGATECTVAAIEETMKTER
jgi:hypothetical protein